MMNDTCTKYRVVVMGKTGTGKSSLCNRLVGRGNDHGVFPVYYGMDGRTTDFQVHEVPINGVCLQVVDTPDFFNMGFNVIAAQAAFQDWDEAGPSSIPTAILFAVPLDKNFSTEDDLLYNVKFKKMLPFKYRDSMIMGFTKMESVACSVEQMIPEKLFLQHLSIATKGRYVEFRENPNADQLQRTVIDMIANCTMRKENTYGRNATGQELFHNKELTARARAALVVQYIVRLVKTIAVRLVSFRKGHLFVCTFATMAAVLVFIRSRKTSFRALLHSAIDSALG